MFRRSVAIIGASSDQQKFGYKSLIAHAAAGYEVYPINPKGGTIEGHQVYTSIESVPLDHLDRVSLYIPPTVGLTLLEQIAAKGCDELWLNPGTESPSLMGRAEELGLNVIVACSLIDCEQRSRGSENCDPMLIG